MSLLQAVDSTVVSLWLGHPDTVTAGRYTPTDDDILAYLDKLDKLG